MSARSPTRVVIVEDDPETVAVLQDLLTELGLHLIACPPSLALADIVTARPHLIILDVRLGILDGIELFHRLRTEPATHRIPVIFFTANAPKVRHRLPNSQALRATVVSKPNITQLIAALQATLPLGGRGTSGRPRAERSPQGAAPPPRQPKRPGRKR
jgi:CheY-like chemotaxis protein